MGWYQSWASKQRGKTSLLVFAVISGTVSFWIGYSKFYSPWRQRKRLQEAEEYANFLLHTEK